MEETYRGKVVLIVNGDDVGVTPVFTDATLDAYFKGMLGSVSIIANGQDVERTVSILKTRPELPAGVHLTLTGDWKPLTSGKSLRNASGLMWDTTEAAALNVKTKKPPPNGRPRSGRLRIRVSRYPIWIPIWRVIFNPRYF